MIEEADPAAVVDLFVAVGAIIDIFILDGDETLVVDVVDGVAGRLFAV